MCEVLDLGIYNLGGSRGVYTCGGFTECLGFGEGGKVFGGEVGVGLLPVVEDRVIADCCRIGMNGLGDWS